MGTTQRIMGACGCGEEQRKADEAKKQVEEAKRAEEEANAEAMNKQKAAEEAERQQRVLDAETIPLNINEPDGKLEHDARLNGTLLELTENVVLKLGLTKEYAKDVEIHVSGHKLEPVTKIVREFTELCAGSEVNLEGIEKAKEAMKKQQAAEVNVHKAAETGNLAELNLVAEFAPERIDKADGKNYTPLHFAAQWSHEAAVILLLSAKADANKRTKSYETPLKLAQNRGVQQLLRDAETIQLNMNGPDGKLDVDARLNGTLQELTEEVVLKLDLPKECAEHVEMHVSGHKLEPVTKIVREFTELWCVDEYTFEFTLAGFEVNLEGIEKAKEAMKQQAAELDVYEAARDGNLADLSFVVKFAPERITPLYGDSSRGGTPLHEAAAAGQEAAVILLLSAKADLTKKDSYGDTPRKSAKDERVKQLLIDVHQAAMTGPLADLNFVVEFAPERINETNEYGGTPLHDAAGYASLEAASLLLSAKADFSKTDNYGMTALDHSKKCTYSDNEKVTQLLIDAAGQ